MRNAGKSVGKSWLGCQCQLCLYLAPDGIPIHARQLFTKFMMLCGFRGVESGQYSHFESSCFANLGRLAGKGGEQRSPAQAYGPWMTCLWCN